MRRRRSTTLQRLGLEWPSPAQSRSRPKPAAPPSGRPSGLPKEKEAAGMKRKLAKTGFKSPYDSDYDDDDETYEYNSGDDVEDGNKESFIEKEAQKIRKKGKAAYFKREMFRCPYCTTKPKPKDGFMNTLCRMHAVYQRVLQISRPGQSMQPS
ncbi:hypothetical protein D1007_36543 [Hordeum vulgare]|nr:hypothetical protein D1007_36543 [Hordeum vulgare]